MTSAPTCRSKLDPSDVRNAKSLEDWYQIDEVPIGKGKFSTVYRAHRRSDDGDGVAGTAAAIKISAKSTRHDPIIQQELQMLKDVTRLRVPKCVHLLDALQTPESWALVLQTFPSSANAAAVVAAFGPMNEGAAAAVVRQILTAVAGLHDAGIVHRDISLENILLGGGADEANVRPWLRVAAQISPSADTDGGEGRESNGEKCSSPKPCTPEAMLTDFGFARYLAARSGVEGREGLVSRSEREAPRSYTPCGSLRYLPMEVLDAWTKGEGKSFVTTAELAASVDVFAMGVVAHILLSGSMPYNGKTKKELAAQQRLGLDLCSSSLWKRVSEPAKQFVRGLMAADPARRWKARSALEHEWLKGENNKN